jgi:hypothetical protein
MLFDVIQAKQKKLTRKNANFYLDENYYIERMVIRDSKKFRPAFIKT